MHAMNAVESQPGNAELQLGSVPRHVTGADEENQFGLDNDRGVLHPDSLGGDGAHAPAKKQPLHQPCFVRSDPKLFW